MLFPPTPPTLFPSNRHPLLLSYVSLIRPIQSSHIAADWCDFTLNHSEAISRLAQRSIVTLMIGGKVLNLSVNLKKKVYNFDIEKSNYVK